MPGESVGDIADRIVLTKEEFNAAVDNAQKQGLLKGTAEKYYKKHGGTINIKKENKGKFTKSAKAAGHSVQEHATAVLNDPKATKLQKRRAQFAKNAKKFKHENGAKMTRSILDNGWFTDKQLQHPKHLQSGGDIPMAKWALVNFLTPTFEREKKDNTIDIEPAKRTIDFNDFTKRLTELGKEYDFNSIWNSK